MKKILAIMTLLICMAGGQQRVFAQADEIAQLALNIEKLAQLKSILSDLKKGYTIVSSGYGKIKDISEGNFQMHELFLDGLLAVSPEVRKYQRIPDIINYQLRLVKEYKAAFGRFKSSKAFSASEIRYMANIYEKLFKQSVDNLEELTTVVTAGKLRMSDDERIKAIDRIYEDMEDKLSFLRHFNNNTSMLALQRDRELHDIEAVKTLSGIKQ
ncbi:TerB family tellurite resistance protein [Pedobacter sp. ISL-68]|uniref:TerB family tellurite resistance protein n=1 Tax=unclassified Pedobacter TaxID=2628915 RepID=UPI001BE59CA6|nr:MULTISPECIES: TerB family tellurite resistance protein [unclassified Pedobacter]MBT2561295.1 TerB family tellurite resistance protein [Pedobacter sp. ISL-64]MBT2590685.1 TerB family tellurite resistance protein [Pedobacter sp. ISL-68]